MKNYIYLFLLFGVTSCFKPLSKIDKITIKTLWEYDTCGAKGFRLFFINYIERNDSSNIFIGENIKVLIPYLGNPDIISNCEDGYCSYWYCIDSPILENGKCGNSQNRTLYVLFDKKSKKIVEFHAVIH